MGEGLDRHYLNDTTIATALEWLRKSFNLFGHPYPKGTSCGDAEASPSGRSTQSAWKQCGARHARLNRVEYTVAKRQAQSTSEWPKTLPQGIQGDRNPLGTPFSPIFRRATKDGATGGRWFSRAVGKKRTAKDRVPEGRRSRIAARTNVLSQQKNRRTVSDASVFLFPINQN